MHAVIFDIDGTLLQSAAVDDELYRCAVREVLGDVILRPNLHEYDFVTDTGILTQVFDDNGIQAGDVNDVKLAFVHLLQKYVDKHGPFEEIPGAGAMLQRMRASPEHAPAMATGGWRESAELKLKSAGIYFDDIPLATSNDAAERTAIMRIALARLRLEPASVTYYGDGPWDRDACAALGWNFIAVGTELGGLMRYPALEKIL